MCLPALRAIRGRFPRAHIAILAKPAVADLYARESCVDEVIRYNLPRMRDYAGLDEAYLRSEIARWTPVIKKLGLKAQ